MRFKIGDRVRVVKPVLGWEETTDECGEVMLIDKRDEFALPYKVWFDNPIGLCESGEQGHSLWCGDEHLALESEA